MAASLRIFCARKSLEFSRSSLRLYTIFRHKRSTLNISYVPTIKSISYPPRLSWRSPAYSCLLKPRFASQVLFSRCMSNESKGNYIDNLKSSPPPALWLGLAGAIPFTGLATLSLVAPSYLDTIMHAQCAYGACILTFIGAIHWGYALPEKSDLKLDWSTLGYSVTPSLVAWSALLMKPEHGLITLFLGLLYALSRDLSITCFPAWYHALRTTLSTLAASSVIVTAVAFYIQ